MAPGLRRVVAENPSKFTAWGTGTYLVGGDGDDEHVVVIDPGPALDSHVDALLRAVEGQHVEAVLITHTHADHSPATAALQAATGAPAYGFGPHPVATDVDGSGARGGDDHEEHGDLDFVPDVLVGHGDVLHLLGGTFECLHTPGHISNHVCYSWREGDALFSGDHVMGWSTSVISPPDGRIDDYLASLELLLGRDETVYYPTHGPPITEPRRYVRQLIEHRLLRERQIFEQLRERPRTVGQLVEVLYADVRPELHEPAGRSVRAHLISLVERGMVDGPDATDAYRMAD